MTVTIQIFDPAMCCSTGVCGPSVDTSVAQFAADVDWLQKQGVAVQRYNLSQQPEAFVRNNAVKTALERGVEVLPIVIVGDEIAVQGAYPTRDKLAALAGLTVKKKLNLAAGESVEASCCAPSSDPNAKTSCC